MHRARRDKWVSSTLEAQRFTVKKSFETLALMHSTTVFRGSLSDSTIGSHIIDAKSPRSLTLAFSFDIQLQNIRNYRIAAKSNRFALTELLLDAASIVCLYDS